MFTCLLLCLTALFYDLGGTAYGYRIGRDGFNYRRACTYHRAVADVARIHYAYAHSDVAVSSYCNLLAVTALLDYHVVGIVENV